jgi:hypothetical protein
MYKQRAVDSGRGFAAFASRGGSTRPRVTPHADTCDWRRPWSGSTLRRQLARAAAEMARLADRLDHDAKLVMIDP